MKNKAEKMSVMEGHSSFKTEKEEHKWSRLQA